MQKSFKDAMEAKTEDYEKLKKKYRQYAILPEEFATDFLEYWKMIGCFDNQI